MSTAGSGDRDAVRAGGGGGAEGASPARTWAERVADPAEPLYTLAIAADLLGLDPQALRRLGDAIRPDGPRPSGNQRRYSRNDLARLGAASELAAQGHATHSIVAILDLTDRLEGR